MKAFVCKEFGPIESHGIEEVPDPVAGDGQVVVDIKATGISFPDVLIVQGLYQFKPPFPFSPGGEISGVVSAVGNGVTRFKEGDRVMGNVGSGGLVEKGAYFEQQLMPLPETMDFKVAAGFSLNYGTTIHGLKQRGELKEGETAGSRSRQEKTREKLEAEWSTRLPTPKALPADEETKEIDIEEAREPVSAMPPPPCFCSQCGAALRGRFCGQCGARAA